MRKLLMFGICFILLFSVVYAQGEQREEKTGGEQMVMETQVSLDLLHEGAFPKPYDFSGEEADISAVFQRIETALYQRAKEIDVSDLLISTETGTRIYQDVVNGNPELYFVTGTVRIECADTHILRFVPSYTETAALASAESSEMAAEIDRILACVDERMTDLEKALAVHEYFVRNYEYDLTYSIYDIEGIFTQKTGVCQAYADGYSYIMNKKLGIPCATLSSDALNHAWNILKINGQWYHVDVTWDDPIDDYFGASRHDYFLISDQVIRDEEHEHDSDDWTISWRNAYYDIPAPDHVPSMTSDRYKNYSWTQAGRAPLVYYRNQWYYMAEGVLYQYDPNDDLSQMVLDTGKYTSNWDMFDIYDGYILHKPYFTDMMYVYSMDGTEMKILPALKKADGFRVKGDILEYVVEENPDKILTYPLSKVSDLAPYLFDLYLESVDAAQQEIEIGVTNYAERSEWVLVMLAAYDSRNRMIHVQRKETYIANGAYWGTEMLQFETVSGAAYYKAFVWDSNDEMQPFCEAVRFSAA